jgi:hypothetical protein
MGPNKPVGEGALDPPAFRPRNLALTERFLSAACSEWFACQILAETPVLLV